MDELTTLNIPSSTQISIDSVAKECPSEGFNYPSFRLLNKKTRVYLSEDHNPDPSISYRLLAVANSRGWFAAVKSQTSGSALIFSSLEDLRTTFADAKPEDNETSYTPKRVLSIPTKANLLAFSSDEAQLYVGLEDGSVVAYDSAAVLTAGTNDIQPSNRIQLQQTPLRRLVPNPGTEEGLKDLVAVVGDNFVRLLNTRLESQGGWSTNDSMPKAADVDWSPKGKHIAIGMQTGDIMTFAVNNKSNPNKHIPPTSNSTLVSLTWLGPTHTFRTSYAAPPEDSPIQHIIVLEGKSTTATYFAPDHPFPCFDRNAQRAYVVNLPKWDVDAGSSANQSLVVVGDLSSVDIEILGSIGNQWFRQSQENPLSLPLDKSMEDTKLLSLEVDLTDSTSSTPIMYAYLNDGSVQAWHMDHPKPYLPITEKNSTSVAKVNSEMSMDSGEIKNDSATAISAVAQPSFDQKSPSPFGSQTTSVFGQSSFGQNSFGQSSTTTSAFGQTSSFGSPSGGTSPFGQSSQANSSTSAFGDVKPASGFGAFGGSTGAFGSGAFGSNTTSSSGGAFSNFTSTSSFGQSSFASGSSNTDSTNASSAPTVTREASMSDSTPAFGGLSLGGSHPTGNAVNTMFGTFGQPVNDTPKETTSAFGGSLLKPAAGFGAFGALSSNSPFANNKPTPTTVSAFAPIAQSQPTTSMSSGFGQTGFATPAFGKPSFVQPAFGQSAFSSNATTTTSSIVSSGFGAFANKTVSLGGEKPASESTTSPIVSSAFGAFANKAVSLAGTEKPAVTASSPPSSDDESDMKPATTSAFGASSGSSSAFKPAAGFGAFGSLETAKSSPFFKKPDETMTVSAFGALSSAPKTPTASSSASPAFGTPSALGATKSPFAPQTPSTSAFGSGASPAFGAPSALGGAKSPFAPQTPSTPATPAPTSGGFSAFGGTTSGFAAFAGSKPSFSELLKKKDEDSGETSKAGKAEDESKEEDEVKEEQPRVSVFGTPTKPSDKEEDGKARVSVFGTPATPKSEPSASPFSETPEQETPRTSVFGTPAGTPKSAFPIIPKSEDQSSSNEQNALNKSTGSLSDRKSQTNVSASSSFVEVTAGKEESGEEDEQNVDDDGEHSDIGSFLSENFEESSYKDGDSINDESEEEDELPTVPEEDEEEEEVTNKSSDKVPVSRSPSATPQPELPSIKVSPSDDDDEDDGSSTPSKPKQTREASTTPPTTPIKEPKAPPMATPPVSSPGTPFSLGLGRPSTKPTRSSPLANAVHSGDDEEEKLATPSKPAVPVVSPKPVFGKLPLEGSGDETEQTGTETKAKRPKTPPLLSQMGPPLSGASKPGLARANTSEGSSAQPAASTSFFSLGAQPAAAASTPSLFGKPMEMPASPKPEFKRATTAPPAAVTTSPSVFGGLPPFSINSATTTPLPSGPSSLFGAPKPPMAPPIGNMFNNYGGRGPPASPAPPIVPAGGLFGGGVPTPPAAIPTLFGGKAPLASSSAPAPFTPASGSVSTSPQRTPPRPQQEVLQEGMQKECFAVVLSLMKEFKEIEGVRDEARRRFEQVYKSKGGSRYKKDLGDVTLWGLEDLPQFMKVVIQYETDLEELATWEQKQRQMLRDIRNSMLKAGTRKEEISRFNKAKDDKEFAKMLKTRTLGPEYTETQTVLRKNIRAIRDRVQKLESSLQENKKKLTQATTLKPSFKAPSLDTINRTYRNIELTIDQQSDEVARLASRIKKLRMVEQTSSPSTRDARLPDVVAHRRPVDYTPNIAETTAAALNAERSAQRLKKALLSVRKQPLFNKRAAAAPPAPLAFDTPQKTSKLGTFAFDAPIVGSLFSTPDPAMSTSEFSLPSWDLPPDDNFNPTTPLAATHGRRGGPTQRKHISVPLKRTNGESSSASSAAPPSFDWGPLPSFPSTPPAAKLPSAFMSFSTPSPQK
ncbi:hypothetical protein D9613_007855 [Agrocybe pediades]|uniref:Nucleoporin Nup159/Nup146 N-terminal domain-containing protein n=1 Tax=Agrocybe pediades TaxID=84607 RepID=A0A8H4VLF5_9AGAR|nr:hypothetical protein D9613_007855 [Agrocybe pediades]